MILLKFKRIQHSPRSGRSVRNQFTFLDRELTKDYKDTTAKFYIGISNMKSSPYMNSNLYTREQLDELEQILQRYSDNHMTICTALNIKINILYVQERLNNKIVNILLQNGNPNTSAPSLWFKRSIYLKWWNLFPLLKL